MIDAVRWEPVHGFVYRLLAGTTTTLIAGTQEWEALDDNDPAKLAAVLIAGSRWALETTLDQIHARAAAEKAAARDISAMLPWAAIAQQIADRDSFYATHPDLRRKAS